MGMRGLRIAGLIAGAWIAGFMAIADDAVPRFCPLVLQQERTEREEQELAADLAATQLAAAESIFSLVDRLWKESAVERMAYLTAKHDRDVAEIESKRQQLLLKRQEAEVEHYAAICSPDPKDSAADRHARRDEAIRRYAQVDCQRIGKDLAIAEVDLAYRNEVLTSVLDLRKNDVATRQDVIRAERDVEMARKRVERQGRRVRECVGSGAGT